MIIIDNTIVSDDFKSACFVCDLSACKGACCVEGDAGAPLDEEEISILEDEIDHIIPFMREEGVNEIKRSGVFDFDASGHYVTPLINGNECAYVVFNEEGIALCAIENAWKEGKTKFRKPVSCHLYPVRLSKYNDFEAVNYHRWHICRPAVEYGKALNVPAYVFLKEALIRKYGEDYYNQLLQQIQGKKAKK
jgi:hypothetical protein